MRRAVLFAAAALALPCGAAPAANARTQAPAQTASVSVAARFGGPSGPMLVVAHRACHNPAPRHGLQGSTPENSIAAIERCVTLGVDMAEVDVRRTRDGFLVLLHDESVDRTTDGKGKVSELTLAEVKKLRLRENEGGADAAITASRVPTLEEGLAAAKGRMLLNLDVQAGLYAETIAAVRRAGQRDEVIVKQPAGAGSPVLADTPPFNSVPFMPVLVGDAEMVAVAKQQLRATALPIALELPRMTPEMLPVLAMLAERAGVRLWVNSLWEGFVAGFGGDIDALRDPQAVWGRMRKAGISVIQTDEPEALLTFLGR